MKLASLALVLAACHSAPTAAPVAQHTPPPAKLGPTVTQEQLAQLHVVEMGRMEDAGGQTLPTTDRKWLVVDGHVISAMSCRPNGSTPSFVADSRHVYVTYAETKLSPPTHLDGGGTMMMPATYCSYQRFVIPDGLELGGELKVAR